MRLGRKRGVVLYAAVTLSAYVTVIAGVLGGLTPRWTLIALAALPVALKGISVASKAWDRPREMAPANASTIVAHLLTGILLAAAYILPG